MVDGLLPGEAPPGASHSPTGWWKSIPFSFTYGGKSSSQLLGRWKRKTTQQPPANGRQQHAITWADEQTGLEVTCEATLFSDFPAVEWLLRLRNAGDKDTPILENIRPLDLSIGVGEKESVVFHHAKGSSSQPDDYVTIDAALAPDQRIALPAEGCPSQTCLPYFNLVAGQRIGRGHRVDGPMGAGVQRRAGQELVLQAGQQQTHFEAAARRIDPHAANPAGALAGAMTGCAGTTCCGGCWWRHYVPRDRRHVAFRC